MLFIQTDTLFDENSQENNSPLLASHLNPSIFLEDNDSFIYYEEKYIN